MSFREKWNAPTNKAAVNGLLVGLAISAVLNGGLALFGGQPNVWSFVIVAAIAWGASYSVLLRHKADAASARK